MKLKRLVYLLLPLLAIVFSANTAIAASANTFQVTSDGAQQKDALIDKSLIVYTNFGGSQGIDIWGYSIDEDQNSPIIERPGDQFVTGHSGKYIVYEDYDGSDYNLRLFNKNDSLDKLIAGGPGAQVGGVTNGTHVAYLVGGACGEIRLYNIKKRIDVSISPTGCGPLAISDTAVIWANGASGGTNLYGYDLKRQVLFDVVSDNNFQESPNIFGNEVAYVEYTTGALGDYYAIKMVNIKNGKKNTLYETTTSTLQQPAISNKFVVWSESTAQHVNGVQAAFIKTGEVFEVQPQGPHQNSHTDPTIFRDTAAWMSFQSGGGDIYASNLSKN